MSSPKMTPAKESAPADTAASVPVSAGTTTPASTHVDAPATEGNLSVPQYHLLQQQKRAQDSADTPSTILCGTSVLNTDGSIPIDYGSDFEDAPMEEDDASSSSAAVSKAAESTPDPLTGSRRTRDDDPGASSLKRPRTGEEAQQPPVPVTPSSCSCTASGVAVRPAWMPSASEIVDRFGSTSPPNPIPLYVCSAIYDVAANMQFDPSTNQRRGYYIGLFHELRWYAWNKTSRKSKVPEWVALCQSWNAFVVNFNNDAKAYRERVTAARQLFETFSSRHMIDHLHSEVVSAGISGAVPSGTTWPHCRFGA
ncbi:hypothetical protein L915_21893, partial [Phytophthora nicotianae]